MKSNKNKRLSKKLTLDKSLILNLNDQETLLKDNMMKKVAGGQQIEDTKYCTMCCRCP